MNSKKLITRKAMPLLAVMVSCLLFTYCGGSGDSSESAPDTTAPGKISLTLITAGTDSVTFTWTDPSDSDLAHISITYALSTATSKSDPEKVSAKTCTFTQNGLSSGAEYYFTATSVDI